ncbi:MAG: TrkH family potassium uptake protein [Deltaproteobacteria bacterium]|nr:TrkH family potassium uptake protein [Deltaproteobacteria bacterium]MBW2019225.1 TrkH family potassium uptake protein [Deltaproteobacteria bacterium]MBW2074031.1 TrkH family potassium uptake protein [Deltaproteobacteria bacterium]RLB80389.1 MAG: TrkH family potassium uptake protein [Deltaproteobacteria bacterium]
MRIRYTLHLVGVLTIFLGLTMVFPLLFGLYYKDESVVPLLKSIAVTLGSGFVLYLLFRSAKGEIMGHREGMGVVAIGWTAAGFFGALPYYWGGVFNTFSDAFFESISGLTTTGASVLNNIEVVARGFLFWRSLTHWLGGMGIIVLSLAILPLLGIGGMQLYKAEVPGPVPDKLKPRIRDTAMVLWKVYVFFSAAETVLLMLGGMDLFEALCHTFGTMATGGFSSRNASIGSYQSPYIDTVVIVFMLFAGINFSLHYQCLKGDPLAFWRNSEFRFFIGVVGIFFLAITLNIYHTVYETLSEAIRFGTFQVVSIITTTGYVTADYEKWPSLSQNILLFCMFLGASAGSTGGGMKCLRIMLLLKHSYKQLFSLIHPHAVTQVKLGGRPITNEVLHSIWGYFMLYLGLFILCAFLLAAMGVDVITSFAAVAATIGNIGPGLGMVGPTDHYAHIPEMGKWLLILCMLLGRLEIYTILILFVPEFWRK